MSAPKMRNLTITAALHAALREEMQADESVIVFGEDTAVYGGVYGVTIGLQGEFGPDRVRDTPISEMAIAGMALGAALGGQRPEGEIIPLGVADRNQPRVSPPRQTARLGHRQVHRSRQDEPND